MRAFTVGHSTRSLDGLLALLTPHGVESMVTFGARRARVVTPNSISTRSPPGCRSAASTTGTCRRWAGGAGRGPTRPTAAGSRSIPWLRRLRVDRRVRGRTGGAVRAGPRAPDRGDVHRGAVVAPPPTPDRRQAHGAGLVRPPHAADGGLREHHLPPFAIVQSDKSVRYPPTQAAPGL
jgi:hypothetical protein